MQVLDDHEMGLLPADFFTKDPRQVAAAGQELQGAG